MIKLSKSQLSLFQNFVMATVVVGGFILNILLQWGWTGLYWQIILSALCFIFILHQLWLQNDRQEIKARLVRGVVFLAVALVFIWGYKRHSVQPKIDEIIQQIE